MIVQPAPCEDYNPGFTMTYLELQHGAGIVTISMSRGKVNALDGEMVLQLRSTFRELAGRDDIAGAVLTGSGAFFSFGLV